MENIRFNSHKVHNPFCDIMEAKIDQDSILTYGIYIKGPRIGEEFCEYYRGENYINHSKVKSYSRLYSIEKTPKKYTETLKEIKGIYNTQFKNS